MNKEQILNELQFKAVRSSGAGGQNVNKVASKVVLSFDVEASEALTLEEKVLLKEKISNRLTAENVLILNCDEARSQFKNKELVIKRFLDLIQNGLKVAKIRKATKVPKSVIKKRIKDKRIHSDLKSNRKKPNLD
ncbi:alternative ribosome rescue aminoacyl-tRNA hydrolase ArfB [Flavobacterium agrisoli]|uniref:Aminoacyl-tRNA hydrolase n=1 Tax=Flavobacterium agrisoli TaxID=2793066 RepID=A0A934UKI6_9FLAO|nr:alternative ribosome rescue aminoacyl-tRNA hydrolase ArfB [Flavobacterium agrisoli]MBK0371012.1 aminoacyl-tRNA hydrolase [Flavobacterium agrisoli]